jgi:hypothetical protein
MSDAAIPPVYRPKTLEVEAYERACEGHGTRAVMANGMVGC